MRKVIGILLVFILLGVTFSCEEDGLYPREYPRITTLPVTDISTEGAMLNAEFLLRGNTEIISYGFVFISGLGNNFEELRRVVIPGTIQDEAFSVFIGSGLYSNGRYWVRAFVETDDFMVYGEEVFFRSLGSSGPELVSFSPTEGHLTDTLRIKGVFNNYSPKVEIDQLEATILEFNSEEISVLIPESLSKEKSQVHVTVIGNTSTFEEPFTLLRPTIESYDTTEVSIGSEMVINGTNFNPLPDQVELFFLNSEGALFPAEILSISENQIVTRIPEDVDSKLLQVTIHQNNFEVIGEQEVTINDPKVDSFFPLSGKTKTEITIQGSSFASSTINTKVRIDGYEAEILEISSNEIVAIVPEQVKRIYSSRDVSVEVEVFSVSAQAPDTFRITDKWFRINDLPFFIKRDLGVWKSLSIDQEGYVLFDGGTWSYNPQTGQWDELTAFPESMRRNPGIFAINNKIYLGTGYNASLGIYTKDFWEYDATIDTWVQKTDYPGEARTGALSFGLGTSGYIGAGYINNPSSGFADVWRYDSTTDNWSQVADHPVAGSGSLSYLASTILNEEAIVGMGLGGESVTTSDDFYKYNANSDQWLQIAEYPYGTFSGRYPAVAFTIGNRAYFKPPWEDARRIGFYDGNTWTLEDDPLNSSYYFSFVIDNVAYIGVEGVQGQEFWSYDVSQPD
jgi:hypothetical protein